jgi:hypothetical protein
MRIVPGLCPVWSDHRIREVAKLATVPDFSFKKMRQKVVPKAYVFSAPEPEGSSRRDWLKVAPHFSVGYGATMVMPSRRDDRLWLRSCSRLRPKNYPLLSIVPPGRVALFSANPTLKCGATFLVPCGTRDVSIWVLVRYTYTRKLSSVYSRLGKSPTNFMSIRGIIQPLSAA